MNDYRFLSAFVKTECCSNCKYLEIKDSGLFLCIKAKYTGEINICRLWNTVHHVLKSGDKCKDYGRL